MMAREEARRGESLRDKHPDLGGGSKRSSRRVKPSKAPAPARPAGEERGPRPKAGGGPSSSLPKKGSSVGGGGHRARSR